MQYSAVVIALFAATALAAPAETLQSVDAASLTETVTEPYVPEVEEPYVPEVEEPYVPETVETYADENTNSTEYDAGTDTGYESGTEQPEYEVPTYEPTTQPCYTKGETVEYGKPIYLEEDQEAYKKYEEYSVAEEFHYPEQIDANQPCPITYKPKDNGYKGTYKVAMCSSTDNYKTCEDVCHDEETCGSYKPSYETIPSDSSVGGCMYRFKVYEADNEEKCTYSKQFPIYNPVYYEKNKDCQPKAELCPPPKYVIPAPKPVQTPVDKPVAPVAPIDKSADKPMAPVAPVPVAPTNETSPIDVQPYTSSAVRSSVSAIVGFAALIAFAL